METRETEQVEFKKSTSELKEAVISLSAMLNKHGQGLVYFGVKNDGTVVGQRIGADTGGDISRAIRQHLTALAHQDGYGVTYYTDSRGRHMARIGRTDGQGVGFMLTAQQAREWLQ